MTQSSPRKKPPRRLLRAVCALVLLGIVCYGAIVAYVCVREEQVRVQKPDGYDAIVVLGAQVKADGSLSVQLEWRLAAALSAYTDAPCPIVCCGAQGADEPAPEGDVMRAWLIEKGVPEDSVVSDPNSYSTFQNLRHAADILEKLGCRRPLVVTSDYHLPRAMALADDFGLEAQGLGSACKPEFWAKNHLREALAWCKYWGRKYLGLPLE